MRSSTDREICGTCHFWTGDRSPVFDGESYPKIDIAGDNGQCENSNSRFFEEKRKSTLKCVHFSKWTEIL